MRVGRELSVLSRMGGQTRCLFVFSILSVIIQPTLAFSPLSPSFARPAAASYPNSVHALGARAKILRAGSGPTRHKFRFDASDAFIARPAAAQEEGAFDAATLLDDERVEKLFAWLCRAFAGDARYGNLMLAFGAVFGAEAEDTSFGDALAELKRNPGIGEALDALVQEALAKLPKEEDVPLGAPHSLRDREQGCLGAMGAGQWTGQWRTRPHALLDVREFKSVDGWAQGLPRGARRTLAKANSQSFSVTSRPIRGDTPAPHSSLAHFRCVLQHEVRLLAQSRDDFFVALQHAIGRYQNCIAQGGEIREYRDADGRVLAFAQEVTKGKVMRGQWFYSTDAGAKSFVWFHSVQELVRRAIEDEGVDFADLGPSGTDAFSELKQKYGFKSVADWHKVADYRGPFRYEFGTGGSWAELDPPDYLFEPNMLERLLRKDSRA